MYRIGLTAAWVVCVLAAIATVILGYASGLFQAGPVSPIGVLATVAPYPALALLAWCHRSRPVLLGIVLALAVAVSGYGLFFFVNDWYWPQPTNPNPWRVMMIPVVIIPQWAVVGCLAAATFIARFLFNSRRN